MLSQFVNNSKLLEYCHCYYGQYSSSSSMPGGAGSKSYLVFLLDDGTKSIRESSGTIRNNSSSVSWANLLGSFFELVDNVNSGIEVAAIRSLYADKDDGGTYSLAMLLLIVV